VDVAVLGAGLDGLLAAHAATREGHRAVIYGDEEAAFTIDGANNRIVRKNIPGITEQMVPSTIGVNPDSPPPFTPEFINEFATEYARKVFGKDFDEYSDKYMLREFDDVCDPDPLFAYNADEIYQKLYDLYYSHIQYQWLTPKWYLKSGVSHDYDMVINTLPMTKWCQGAGGHIFQHVYYWTTNYAPYGPLREGEIYLCSDDRPHYIQANLWGSLVVEWPEKHKPPMAVTKAIRPLGKLCDCDQRVFRFHNIGAMANWTHGWHIHDSFEIVQEVLGQKMRQPQQLDLGI
jgi:hypothetical protein